MDAEQARSFLRKLPYTTETRQWGDNLLYWVGDKAIGGKMFALINLDEDTNPAKPTPVMMFYAGAERAAELLETEGMIPAPYMARLHWIATMRWNTLRRPDLEALLRAAHAGVEIRLPAKTRATLSLPQAEREKVIEERKKLLAERAAKVSKSSTSKKKPARTR